MPDPARPSRRRLDIQGLRALCMAQVLGYHLWRIGSPVGVDAFIMISAYLLTGSFLRRAESSPSHPPVLDRWLRTFKRLLPPLVVVTLATVAAGLVVLPATRSAGLVEDAVASVTYRQNWRLASQAADYFAENHALASPLQHLWSMSMQGQVFLLWPAILAACAVLARRTGRPVRLFAVATFAAVAACSLGWLMWAAPTGGSAYFMTRGRLWEFALGSAVAAAAPWLRVPSRLADLADGTALLVLALFFTTSIGSYPGPVAAVPMLAVSVLLLGAGGSAGRVTRLLSARPLAAVGDMSYSVYLVHWPLIVLWLTAAHRGAVGLVDGLALVAASLALAAVLDRFVDRPAQRHPRAPRLRAKEAGVVLVSLCVGLAPLAATRAQVDRMADAEMTAAADLGDGQHPGARALTSTTLLRFTEDPVPGPLSLREQWVSGFTGPCDATLAAGLRQLTVTKTSCGTQGDPATATKTLTVVGDSHVEQTVVPVAGELARRGGWAVRSILSGGCTFGAVRHYAGECAQRNRLVIDDLLRDPPDVLLVQSTYTPPDSPDEVVRAGLEEAIPQLVQAGITVIGFRDNPRSQVDLYECSAQRPQSGATGGCALPQSRHLAATDPALALERFAGFHEIDPTDLYCRAGTCHTIIGNVFVYLDTHHLTKAYATTMAPILADRVEQALAG